MLASDWSGCPSPRQSWRTPTWRSCSSPPAPPTSSPWSAQHKLYLVTYLDYLVRMVVCRSATTRPSCWLTISAASRRKGGGRGGMRGGARGGVGGRVSAARPAPAPAPRPPPRPPRRRPRTSSSRCSGHGCGSTRVSNAY